MGEAQKGAGISLMKRRHARPLELDSEEDDSGKMEDSGSGKEKDNETELSVSDQVKHCYGSCYRSRIISTK